MLIFEITKTNTPLPQKGHAPILIAPPQPRQRLVLWNKAKPMLHHVYTGCSTARQIPDRKLLPLSIYDVLTQISNDFQLSCYHVQCRQTLVLLTYRKEPKQPLRPITSLPLLEFSPALESWSDIYTGPTSCLIVPQTFTSFVFIRHLYLSVTRLFTERSLLHIMSRHAPYFWLAIRLFWYSAPTQFSKTFFFFFYCIPSL